ncbi:MAG: hypothetical protein IJP65_01385 [Bacteroidales bacterium]|nr:hypothetical protein [Bacteroidales bacterium]
MTSKKQIVLLLFSLLLGGIGAISCQNNNADLAPRTDYIQSIATMYEPVGLTDHLPKSWQNPKLRTSGWNAYYFSPCEETIRHCYRSVACFIDNVKEKEIKEMMNSTDYVYKTLYHNDSALRFDPVFINDEHYIVPSYCEPIHAPIYDFCDAVFNAETIEDSLCIERQVPPADLVVYVVEAKAGNFWVNKGNADKENRSALPEKWRHGFSRGFAISASCKKVCWWAISW